MPRILVVDDNTDSAETLAACLTLSGHETCTVTSGRDAIAALDRSVPDVLIVDIGMPDVDGYDVARHAKSLRRPPRVIALSGFGACEDRARSEEAGCDVHLVKPAAVEEVERVIAMLLARQP